MRKVQNQMVHGRSTVSPSEKVPASILVHGQPTVSRRNLFEPVTK